MNPCIYLQWSNELGKTLVELFKLKISENNWCKRNNEKDSVLKALQHQSDIQ